MSLPLGDLAPEMHIESVSFGLDQIEVTFVEARHRTKRGLLAQTALIPLEDLAGDDVAELQDMLRQIVDDWLVRMRNPPETQRGSR